MVHRYYHRLSTWQQRVYRRSDEVTSVPLHAAAGSREAALAVGRALTAADARQIARACQALVRRVCRQLDVTPPAVTVLADRPAGHWGELHGLYHPTQGPDGTITVWMRTARRGRVVAFRTFLRTLLHELCHHLDFALLGLTCSFHTTGFRKREASLYRQLLPTAPGSGVAVAAGGKRGSDCISRRRTVDEAMAPREMQSDPFSPAPVAPASP